MNFLKWLQRAFQPHYRDEVYSYLAQSVDIVDLEHRMAQIQRRGYL
jgi:hypothetical protein